MDLKRRLKKTWRDSVNLWENRHYYLYQRRRLQPKLSPLSTQIDFRQSKEILERILTQNILPFWDPEAIDSEDGGYRLNHDLQGNYQGKTNKHIVTQARLVWFFSRLVNSSYGTSEHLQAAQHGYEFLYNCMWDKQFGGFYWEVDATGKNITKPDKHLYGQAFGLYALWSRFRKCVALDGNG